MTTFDPGPVEIRIIDPADPAGPPLGTVTHRRNPTLQREFNDCGSGGFSIHREDTDRALLTRGRLAIWRLADTDVGGIMIESRPERIVAESGVPVDRTLDVQGRGLLCLLDDAAIYPERGLLRVSPDTRLFGFPAAAYDDTHWGAAVEIKRQGDTGPHALPLCEAQWDDAPTDWPDPDAFWIWSRAQVNCGDPGPLQPIGLVYFRREFTLAAERTVSIFFSADDGYILYLDGERIAEETRAFMWAETSRYDVFLDAGDHVLAIVGEQIERAAAASNVAGVILTVMETTEGGEELGDVIVHTDSSWRALDYPPEPPGMTPGEILRLLVEEAQDRGGLPGVTLGFTDADDTADVAWEQEIEIGFTVGSTILDAARTLAELLIDIDMTPTLELRAWNRDGGIQTFTSDELTLTPGGHIGGLQATDEQPLLTVALARDSAGRWVEATQDPIGPLRRERLLAVGTAPSDPTALTTAEAVIAEFGPPAERLTFAAHWISGESPLIDWAPGDLLFAPTRRSQPGDLDTAQTRILTITLTEDAATGRPTVAVEASQDDPEEESS